MRQLYEQLLCGLLQNIVRWQQPPSGNSGLGRSSSGSHAAPPLCSFTAGFLVTLDDCMAVACDVIGAQRYVGGAFAGS